ncbi:MAG: hypothetical protein KDI62_19510 [Anaerolineae bacterium]|nr:hypothetical protein [Anaerolineae bacterium]MCB9078631.1 hypothetical protein [Anaerolineaceae bacterium]MCB9104947.1 hypothetical protein [Anaerolineales bacterium]
MTTPSIPKAATLILRLDLGTETDAEELDQVTRRLLSELCDLDLESVGPVSGGPSPEGAKAGDAFTMGALAIAVLPTFVPKLVEYLQAWTLRNPNRTLKIKTQHGDRAVEVEFDPTTISADEVTSLVEKLNQTLANQADQ